MKLTIEQTNELKTYLKDKTYSPFHRRLQVILFRAEGLSYKEITNLIGYSKYTIWSLQCKYELDGISALIKETRGGRNRQYSTLQEEEAFLKEQLTASLNGEFVTINSLYEAYQKQVGHPTTKEGFYALLKGHGWRKVSPRPQHPKKADAETILASKNKIKLSISSLSNFQAQEKVCYSQQIFLYQDEAGFGRISKLGSCWSPKGYRPHVASHHIREYRYCYGAVDAHTGDSFFIIAGGCNTDWMNVFLKQLSEAYPDDYILLVMDNAVWHKSSTLEKPHNIGFEFIPPYTPEMNPIEQVWAEIRKRGFKNKAFKTLDDVINKLQVVIRELDWSILKPIVSRQWLKNT
ncbi:TPA: IS630 family transposase [Streptococcus suis]